MPDTTACSTAMIEFERKVKAREQGAAGAHEALAFK
jgi:hypothetical protein